MDWNYINWDALQFDLTELSAVPTPGAYANPDGSVMTLKQMEPSYTPEKIQPATVTPTTPAGESEEDKYWKDRNAREAAAAQAAAEAAAAERRRVIASVKNFFSQYGMMELWDGAYSYLTQGYTDADQISLMLSNDSKYQEAYFRRFPGVSAIREVNEERIATGLPIIAEPSPKAYIELEAGYRQAVAGLPGTWATNEDIAAWMSLEVSPVEVADRVTTATNYINYDANSYIKDELREIYGMSDQEMVAYVLDTERTEPMIEEQYNKRLAQATVGGAADSLGLSLADAQRNEIAGSDLYGKSFGNSASGFKAIAEIDDAYERLGKLSNIQTNIGELVSDQFGISGAADAAKKKKKLASQERARFGGQSALSRTSLAQRKAR
jgi:hypothetical protein